jgi:hypothetical protein
MAAKHGTRHRYNDGCRCDECRGANAAYRRRYRQRATAVIPIHDSVNSDTSSRPGLVEAAVGIEVADIAEARPGMAQIALAMARVLDNPRAVSSQPAAAKVLTTLLDKLRSASAQQRRGNLALVREMTTKDGA